MKTMQHNNADKDYSFFQAPVPLRQQPVNQYRELRDKSFFRWVVLSRAIYCTKLSAAWVTGLLFALYATTLKADRYGMTLSDFLWAALMGKIAVLFCLAKLYAAWNYVHLRLVRPQIDYRASNSEEMLVWHKPKSVAIRDCLLDRFQVRPAIQRLKQTVICILLLFVANLLTLFLIINP